jgi:cell division protein FtsB
MKPKIVCLCGSTRFKREFINRNFKETMAGNIVLTVGWFGHADGDKYTPTPEEKVKLDELHKRKIDLADEVLVLDVGGYIGESTRSEINYAKIHGKPIRFIGGSV